MSEITTTTYICNLCSTRSESLDGWRVFHIQDVTPNRGSFLKEVHACKTCVGDDDRDTLYNRVLKWFLG